VATLLGFSVPTSSVVPEKSRTLAPEAFYRLIRAVPERHPLMLETFIEADIRWTELIEGQNPLQRLHVLARWAAPMRCAPER
jgi:hypothetical protein